jgi:hypothetical protein
MVFNKRKYSPLVMRGGGLVDAVGTQWGKATSIIKPLISEVFRLLPDGILFGSAFFALMSQSFAMGMFVLSMLEASVVGGLLQKLLTYMDLARTLPTISEDPSKCFPSTFAPSLETIMSFGRDSLSSAFPSFPIWFMSTASAYVVGSVWSQQKELQALGPEYAARFYISVAVTTLLLFATITYRLAYTCDGTGIAILTTLFGLIMGGLLVFQNNYLFGRDATNFTGIPLLVDRTKDGKPLYVCTTNQAK